MSSRRPTWQGLASALPPACLISRATNSQSSSLRLDTITWAPCSASSLAISSPIPRLAPVTSAIFPLRSNKLVVTISLSVSQVPVFRLISDQVDAHLRKHPCHLSNLPRLVIRRVTAHRPLLDTLRKGREPEEAERKVEVPVLNRRDAPKPAVPLDDLRLVRHPQLGSVQPFETGDMTVLRKPQAHAKVCEVGEWIAERGEFPVEHRANLRRAAHENEVIDTEIAVHERRLTGFDRTVHRQPLDQGLHGSQHVGLRRTILLGPDVDLSREIVSGATVVG